MRFTRLLIAAAVALMLASLGGVLPAWMPGTAALAGVVVLLALIRWISTVIATEGTATFTAALRRHGFAIGLTAIAAAGLTVRLLGIAHGPGHVPTDIDENRLAMSVMHFFQTGEIEHDTVEHYPGIHYWLLAGSFLLTYLWGLMSETLRSFAETPPDPFVVAGRTLNAFLEFFTIILTGLIGRSLAGNAAGLWSAALMAFAPLAMVVSSQLRNEAALVLTAVAATYAAVVAADSPSRRPLFIGGALAGMAAAIKYSGVFVLLPVLAASLWSGAWRERWSRAGLAVGGFALALATTNHFLWADFPNFVRQLSTEVGMTGAGHWAAMENPRLFYPINLAQLAFGWPIVFAATGYSIYALTTGQKRGVLLVLFPLTYLWFMSSRPAQFPRWVYTLTPFVACASVAGLWFMGSAIQRALAKRRGITGSPRTSWPVHALIGLFVLPMIPGAAKEISRRPSAPPYALAEAWLAQSSSPGDRVLSEEGWLDLKDTGLKVERTQSLRRSLNASNVELNTFQWIVVPETSFADPNIKRLTLAHAFDADVRFGGNAGIDVRVYQPPPLPPVDGSDVLLGSAGSADLMGLGWTGDRSEASGAGLEDAGGRLFIPTLGEPHTRFEFELVATKPPADGSAPLTLTVNDEPVALEVVSSANGRQRVLSAEIPGTSARTKVLTLVLKPAAGTGPVRVLRCIRRNSAAPRSPSHG